MSVFQGQTASWDTTAPTQSSLVIWVYDTTEVPAGITFNPDKPSGALVDA